MDDAVAQDARAGERYEGHLMARVDRRLGCDPAGLAGAEEADAGRVDPGKGTGCSDGSDRVVRQQRKVALVARAAVPLRLADAPLVVAEERDPAADEAGHERPVAQAR